jgi:AcrR family transcriptional regulator
MAMQKTARRPSPPARAVKDTGAKLVDAAAKEFRLHGFAGTDTNKIARRAGFAPQTFYRWFRDKTEIFLAVYRAWEEEEKNVLAELQREGASVAAMVDAVIVHHRGSRIFRRSLRQLSVEVPVVRKARAESRLRQIERFRKWKGGAEMPVAGIATMLLEMERLCDAVAEDEFADLGIDDRTPRAEIAILLSRLRQGN